MGLPAVGAACTHPVFRLSVVEDECRHQCRMFAGDWISISDVELVQHRTVTGRQYTLLNNSYATFYGKGSDVFKVMVLVIISI